MEVIGRERLRDFWEKHPPAKSPLQAWYQTVESVEWEKFTDVRRTYRSVDRFRRCYIFNVGGNKYRLIARIDFPAARVYVREVLSHAEYDTNRWKRSC